MPSPALPSAGSGCPLPPDIWKSKVTANGSATFSKLGVQAAPAGGSPTGMPPTVFVSKLGVSRKRVGEINCDVPTRSSVESVIGSATAAVVSNPAASPIVIELKDFITYGLGSQMNLNCQMVLKGRVFQDIATAEVRKPST